jgi:hypothetical protein
MAEPDEDGRLARVKRGVCRIAIGHKLNRNGRKQRITRDEQRDIARAICLEMGWPFKWEANGGRG